MTSSKDIRGELTGGGFFYKIESFKIGAARRIRKSSEMRYIMAFCQNCGQQLPENANACPGCGTFVNAQAAPQQNQQNSQQNYQQNQQAYQQPQPGFQQNQPGYQQPLNPTVMPDQDVQSNRGIAWLSYVGLLFLIPMFARKQSPYCQHHVKQGATLCAVSLTYEITKAIFLAIINLLFPGETYFFFYTTYRTHSTVYNIFNWLFIAGSIFLAVLAIIGIVNAATGKKNELPLIGKIPWIAKLLDNFYAKP